MQFFTVLCSQCPLLVIGSHFNPLFCFVSSFSRCARCSFLCANVSYSAIAFVFISACRSYARSHEHDLCSTVFSFAWSLSLSVRLYFSPVSRACLVFLASFVRDLWETRVCHFVDCRFALSFSSLRAFVCGLSGAQTQNKKKSLPESDIFVRFLLFTVIIWSEFEMWSFSCCDLELIESLLIAHYMWIQLNCMHIIVVLGI